MIGDIADWGEIRIRLRNLHRLLQTRVNLTGLCLRERVWGPLSIHVES